ncbi:MAG TPA: thioesterase [Paludibacteraceae bacterium]|nr:thioesterase [Paludibacteraceae bacterium]HQB69059.1 thioesterase [Paludibacteraceae bacterium]HRS67650.1 thioesterase [Paludibacteraceae bacterium]
MEKQRFEFFIYPQEVDYTKRMTLTALGGCLLNAAGLAASEKGFGMESMHAQGLAWVVSRLAIEMEHYPTQYEKITIETWVHDCGKLVTTRNFVIFNERGEQLGKATSLWSMIDFATRRPVNLQEKTDLSDAIIAGNPIMEAPIRLDELHVEPIDTHTVRYSDIDFNKHTNSMKYIEWMLNTFNLAQFEHRILARFDVNYTHEALFGEQIAIVRDEKGDEIYFDLKSSTGRSLCKTRMVFKAE